MIAEIKKRLTQFIEIKQAKIVSEYLRFELVAFENLLKKCGINDKDVKEAILNHVKTAMFKVIEITLTAYC